ncbi:hypothetical protein F2Q69_00044088 [Brassica cretica]|uniref:Uncharacterized protein n=1 Tax=Brassica cretica TaxID=69181 RepID=A0A8S9NS42_BRACR|nr:hypothetical protein F2Q69_00044088 [Brassica cretica]
MVSHWLKLGEDQNLLFLGRASSPPYHLCSVAAASGSRCVLAVSEVLGFGEYQRRGPVEYWAEYLFFD